MTIKHKSPHATLDPACNKNNMEIADEIDDEIIENCLFEMLERRC